MIQKRYFSWCQPDVFRESTLFWISWRSCKHCFKNEWILDCLQIITYLLTRNEVSSIFFSNAKDARIFIQQFFDICIFLSSVPNKRDTTLIFLEDKFPPTHLYLDHHASWFSAKKSTNMFIPRNMFITCESFYDCS